MFYHPATCGTAGVFRIARAEQPTNRGMGVDRGMP
jgi:hypothetical protein